MNTTDQKNGFSVKAYQGDARTLLAFNLVKAKAKNLAGFTIQVGPDGKKPYFLFNTLRFEKPKAHAQVVTEPPNSSVNSPIHKFRWGMFRARCIRARNHFSAPIFTRSHRATLTVTAPCCR